MRSDNLRLAILYGILASLFYALMGVFVKIAEQTVPNEMVVFFRQVISLVIFAPIFYFQKSSTQKIKTQRFPLHLLRAFASISASYCLFYAIEYLPLVDALTLSYSRPLFLPLVAYVWMGKKWRKNVWFGLLVGFLGIVLILKPSHKVFDIAALVGLAAGLFGAIAFASIRRLTKSESANKIFLYYLLLSLPITAVPLVGGWKAFTLREFFLLALVGLVGMLYQMMMTRAYRHAKAYKVSSVLYATVIFAAAFDWFIEGKFLDIVSIIGVALIILGSVATLKTTAKDTNGHLSK